MRTAGKGCFVVIAVVILLPAALGLMLFLSAPKLAQREVETPQISDAQIQQVENKLQLAPEAKEETLTLNVTELNALFQKGIQAEPALKQGRVTLIEGGLAIDAGFLLPEDSAGFPMLLRSFAGKEVSVHLEVSPNTVDDEVYLSIDKASIGVIPLPVNTLLGLLPSEFKGSIAHTEHGIKLDTLVGPHLDITDIKITHKDLQVGYKTK